MNDAAVGGGLTAPRAVLFDWDNTLVDSWTTIHAALVATFEAMGQEPWSLDETRRRARYSIRESFPQLFGAKWEEAASIFYEGFERFHIERLTPLPGAAEMLAQLHRRDILLGVVSNKTGRFLREEAVHLGWDTLFHAVVGAGDAAHDKPAVDPLHMALRGSAVAAGVEVWFVGDSGIDMEIAHRAACVPILLREDDESSDEFEKFQPKVRFACCLELANYVTTL